MYDYVCIRVWQIAMSTSDAKFGETAEVNGVLQHLADVTGALFFCELCDSPLEDEHVIICSLHVYVCVIYIYMQYIYIYCMRTCVHDAHCIHMLQSRSLDKCVYIIQQNVSNV